MLLNFQGQYALNSNSTREKMVVESDGCIITTGIYAPMIFYTAPCIMFWMCEYPLRGQVGPTPSTFPSNGYARIQNIMHRAV